VTVQLMLWKDRTIYYSTSGEKLIVRVHVLERVLVLDRNVIVDGSCLIVYTYLILGIACVKGKMLKQ
jgi:hypothetical protein